MLDVLIWMSLGSPLMLVPPTLAPQRWLKVAPDRMARNFERWTAIGSGLALLGSITMTLAAPSHEPSWTRTFLLRGGLTAVMLPLVSFLTFAVVRYSRSHLEGQPTVARFIRLICLASLMVQVMVLTGNFLLLCIAWMGLSIVLHRLLTYYAWRPGAQLAARKKFIISRLGDSCLIGALIISYLSTGTWDLLTILRKASTSGPHAQLLLPWAGLLLALAAILKSAQFPFHTWLPDTMEAPTPVSAFMHAGIINAGGFLILRTAPLVMLSPAAHWVLLVAGGLSAFGGTVVMVTQTSIKRSLGFSTVAQMGFMLLECGLGAMGLALLHIVAHAIYKAYAFMAAGTPPSEKVDPPPAKPWTQWWGVATALVLMGLLDLALLSLGWHVQWVLAIPIEAGLLLFVRRMGGAGLWLTVAVIATAAGLFVLHTYVTSMLQVGLAYTGMQRWIPHLWQIAVVAGLFVSLAGVEALLGSARFLPPMRWVYVAAYNGFYLHVLANRLVLRLWPKDPSMTFTE